MPIERLKKYLDENDVRYSTVIHAPAFTAQETAAFAHIPGRDLAKTVIVKLDGRVAMVVLPAPDRVNGDLIRQATGATEVALVPEREFRHLFPDCEAGAMPPFGNLYGLPVYVTERLTRCEEIAFNAGSHRELIRMPYLTFARLVQPTVLDPKRESGLPGGGIGRRDEVGGSGVYPASAGHAPAGAVIRNQARWGQGRRGPAGYEDAGSSELYIYEAELEAAGGEPPPEDGEEREQELPERTPTT